MSTLLVDIGNSRVKWATLEQGRLGEQRAAEHSGWTVDDWRRVLFAQADVSRVIAATVAGGPSADALRAATRLELGLDATFVATAREAAGVRNAYADPQLLGVDRWLAVLAAHRSVSGPCCVADIGTAATIDAVAADGQHLGGFIVPGPALMMRALWRGTSELAAKTATSGASAAAWFADNTRDAIERGCCVAIAALIDRSVAEVANRVGAQPVLLLTGGASRLVLPYVTTSGEVVPDLVLRGLAVLAGTTYA
jgi:type III pantothenate kinase